MLRSVLISSLRLNRFLLISSGRLIVRNINLKKCHELFEPARVALCWLAVFFAAETLIFGQGYRPPFVAPPTGSNEPNAANPNQRLRPPRANAVGPEDFVVNAITEEKEGEIYHLRGAVHLETQDMMLNADEVDYNEETGEAFARGHVKFEHFYNGDKLECDHAEYNVNNETGKFYQVHGTSPAKIQSKPGLLTTTNPFYFQGEWAERLQDRYVLYKGFVTDCKVPRPWWMLRGAKFDIIPHERAIGYHSVFWVRGFPLFYAPAFYKSLKKNPRQSGFLTPNIGHSSIRGYMYGIGYYWAINRSYDMLYRAEYFTQGALSHMVDFRGKIKPGTDFNVNLYAVNNSGINNTIGTDGKPAAKSGLQLNAQMKSDLGDGWTARGEVNYLSSFIFRQTFSESFHEAIFSDSRSIGYLTKHWNTFGVTLEADRDQEFNTVLDKDYIIIRHLPQLNFTSREHEISDKVLPLWFSLQSSAGFVDRTQPGLDTRTFVSRLDAEPRLTTAFHFDNFSLMVTGGIRETQYGESLVNGQPAGKDFLRSAQELNVQFVLPSLSRIYKAPKWMRNGDKLKHVIETRADYKYVTGIGSDYTRLLRFDETDLLTNTNEVNVSITNRFFVKHKDGFVNEPFSWEISQSRYFDPTFGGAVLPGQRNVVLSTAELTGYSFLSGPRSYSPITSTLRWVEIFGLEWRTDYDPLRRQFVNSAFTVDYRYHSWFGSVGYNQVHEDPVLTTPSDQMRLLVAWGNPSRKGWNAATTVYYDFSRELMQYAIAQVNYNTDCCGLAFQYRRFNNIGFRDETQYRIAFAVSNIGTFGSLRKQERIF